MAFRETNRQKEVFKNILEALNGQQKSVQKKITLYREKYNDETGRYKNFPYTFYGNDKVGITKKQLEKNKENTKHELLWENVDSVNKRFTLRFNCCDEDRNTYTYMKSILEFYNRFGWTKYIVFVHDEGDIRHIYDVLKETRLGEKFPKLEVEGNHWRYNKETNRIERKPIERNCYFDLLNIQSTWWDEVTDEDRGLFLSKIDTFMKIQTPVILIINYARVLSDNSNLRLRQSSGYTKDKKETLSNLELLFTTRPIVIVDDWKFDYRYLRLTSKLTPLFTLATKRWLHDAPWL